MDNLGRQTVQFLNNDQVTNLQNMYEKLYPDFDKSLCVVPNSFMKSTSVTLGYEIFGSIHSRNMGNCMIMANWNKGEGNIIETNNNNFEVMPGIIDFVLHHNLIIDDIIRLHLIIKVFWYTSKPGLNNYCGPPVEVWSRHICDVEGDSSFMLIQRVRSKFVECTEIVRNKKVVFVCPVNKCLSVL